MKHVLLLLGVICCTCTLVYSQITKDNTTGGIASTGAVSQTINFANGDFGSGITVADVNVSITWQGEDDFNTFFNEEVMVSLTSPSGTTVELVQARRGSQPPTYTGLSSWGTTTTTFDDQATGVAINTNNPMSGSWQPHNPLSTFIGETPLGDWTLTISYINFLGTDQLSWSGFTIGIAGGLMPVELTKFQAKEMKNGQVQIEWQTASEYNNNYFLLERSTDAKDWKPIAKIDGSGTSFDQVDYQFIDQEILKGAIYYRLKQVDFDATYEYSKVVIVKMKEGMRTQLKIFPNPVEQFVNLQNAIGKIRIYNSLNQIVRLIEIEEENYQLDLTDLPNGPYLLEILHSKDREIKRQQFIKL